jgi:6-phosphogluconolactonase (cycloisomerase 2 family)
LIGPAIQTTDAQPHVFINSIGNFMYIDSVWSNKVYAYAPNSATGALTPISGSPYQLGVPIGPNGQGDLGGEMSLDGTGKFLRFYNVNGATPGTSLSNTNTVFQIDPTTGALSHQTYFTNVTNYEGPVVVDPTGAYAYTGNTTGALYLQTGLLSNYTVNASNGVITLNNITPQSGFESTGGLEPLVIMHPSGKFMYVFNETSQSVDTNFDIFTINGANGTVTPSGLGLYDAGGSISSFQVEPKGRFAYIVINQKTQVCTIDPTTGILTKVGTPAATTADGVTGAFFARGAYTFDPTGSFAWATTYTATGTPQLSAFSINSTTGALTSITTYPFPTSTGILAGMNLASF